MNTRRFHCTLAARILLMAGWACALTGCWEEIHYTPPSSDGAPTPVAATPPTNDTNAISDDAAGDFGDDVAASLADSSADQSPTDEPLAENSQPQATDSGESASIPDVAEPPLEAPTADRDAAVNSKSRLAAWSLGSTLSLAALANDRAASADRVDGWFATAREEAAVLGTSIADLPPRPAADQIDLEGRRASEYLFGQGKAIGSHLAQTFGDDHAALFEVALKSNILLLQYQPEGPISKLLAAAISQASERAQLPPELVQPVLQAVEAKATVKEVRDAVFDMHERVKTHLSAGQL